jgi:hypothetical protein
MIDLAGFSRFTPDDDHVNLVPGEAARCAIEESLRRGRESVPSVYGLPLAAVWNETWEFVADEENIEDGWKGLGDCADVGIALYALVSARAQELVVPLLEKQAEILPARFNGQRILVFNVTRRIAREDLNSVGPNDVFRVEPTGLYVFVGANVRKAFENAGLTGLKFAAFNPNARVPLI